jgi:hypothetical protein
MAPEITCQTAVGTPSKIVLALRRRLNSIIESIKLIVITIGRLTGLLLVLYSEPPITTGKRGKMHGAATVRMPARNEVRISVMVKGFL